MRLCAGRFHHCRLLLQLTKFTLFSWRTADSQHARLPWILSSTHARLHQATHITPKQQQCKACMVLRAMACMVLVDLQWVRAVSLALHACAKLQSLWSLCVWPASWNRGSSERSQPTQARRFSTACSWRPASPSTLSTAKPHAGDSPAWRKHAVSPCPALDSKAWPVHALLLQTAIFLLQPPRANGRYPSAAHIRMRIEYASVGNQTRTVGVHTACCTRPAAAAAAATHARMLINNINEGEGKNSAVQRT